jgi:hypothetical protein
VATKIEITCIRTSDQFRAHERIASIGGTNFAGRRWTMSQAGAIRGMEDGKYSFFMNRGGKVINVIVATSTSGHKYFKTYADGEIPNTLLSLPECPD